MDYGVFDWIDIAAGRSIAEVYDDRLAIAAHADRGAFSRYHVAEHHAAPLGLASSPALFVAAAARETSRIRLVPSTFVVPFYHPLRLVEEIGMLDQLSHGRLEVGVGKGSSPFEAAMFGLTAEEVSAAYDGAYGTLIGALESGTWTSAGGDVEELVVRPSRVPAFWYPTARPASAAAAARNGHHVLYGFSFITPTPEEIREVATAYFALRDDPDARFGTVRHILVAETDERAWELALPAFAAHNENFSGLWRRHGVHDFDALPDLRQWAAEHRAMIGSPAAVARQVRELVDRSGINYLAGAFAWGSLPVAAALESVELFDRQVIPAVGA